MTSELEISIKNLIRRWKELNEFKDSGSVKAGVMETFQLGIEELRKSYEDPNGNIAEFLREYYRYKDGENRKLLSGKDKRQLKHLTAGMESRKIVIDKVHESMRAYQQMFRKYNVPKRFQMTSDQPLKPYLGRLQEFMKSTWREQSEKSREKEQRSLFEWMEKLDQSNEEGKIAFDALKTTFTGTGIRISMFFIDYFLLIMEVSNIESEEILALSLYEVKAILKCLTVEENSNSIVINTFLKMVQFFEGAMKLAGPFSDEAKGQKGNAYDEEEKAMFFLDDERKDGLLHLLFIEVLRLEVSFCSPDLPMKLPNEVYFSMASHLSDNVFEEKLERIGDKIDGLDSDFQFAQEEGSSEMNFLWQVLEAGVEELWTELDPKAGSLTKLVLL